MPLSVAMVKDDLRVRLTLDGKRHEMNWKEAAYLARVIKRMARQAKERDIGGENPKIAPARAK